MPTPGFTCEVCISAEVDAAAARTRRHALAFLGAGALLLAVVALLWSTGRDLDLGGWARMPLSIWVGVAAVGCFGIGVGMLRFRPKLQF